MGFGIALDDHEKNTEEIINLFKPQEGTIAFYYGKVRNGKTYNATADIWELLQRGEVVIANWIVDFKGFDERESFARSFFKFLLGREYYFHYKADNFYFFAPDSDRLPLVKKLRKEVGVHIFIDEGQWVLNSHNRKVDEDSQKLVLTNGHFCRSLNIISQRPGNVLKDYRSQVTFWYKCEKVMAWPFLIFKKTIIEDMKEDMPDEESEDNKSKVYFAKKWIMESYDTHFMRDKDAVHRRSEFDLYRLSRFQRFLLLGSFFIPKFFKRRSKVKIEPVGERMSPMEVLNALVEEKRATRRLERVVDLSGRNADTRHEPVALQRDGSDSAAASD